jgi:hypothetical protein
MKPSAAPGSCSKPRGKRPINKPRAPSIPFRPAEWVGSSTPVRAPRERLPHRRCRASAAPQVPSVCRTAGAERLLHAMAAPRVVNPSLVRFWFCAEGGKREIPVRAPRERLPHRRCRASAAPQVPSVCSMQWPHRGWSIHPWYAFGFVPRVGSEKTLCEPPASVCRTAGAERLLHAMAAPRVVNPLTC